MLLTLAYAVLIEYRIKPLRQFFYKLPAVRILCRADDLFIRGIGLAEADIFANGAALYPCFLKHHAEAAAQSMA